MLRFGLLMCVCLFFLGCVFFLLLGPRARLVFLMYIYIHICACVCAHMYIYIYIVSV